MRLWTLALVAMVAACGSDDGDDLAAPVPGKVGAGAGVAQGGAGAGGAQAGAGGVASGGAGQGGSPAGAGGTVAGSGGAGAAGMAGAGGQGGAKQCKPGATDVCYSTCAQGQRTCGADGVFGQCIVQQPKEEVCDGIDNDCDGQVDEGIAVACETACGPGVRTCPQGELGPCYPTNPPPEVCDGVDNDCNGLVDDGLEDMGDCDTGNVGECAHGRARCVDGQIICNSGPVVAEVLCNGKDENCDGIVDNGCAPPVDCSEPPKKTECGTCSSCEACSHQDGFYDYPKCRLRCRRQSDCPGDTVCTVEAGVGAGTGDVFVCSSAPKLVAGAPMGTMPTKYQPCQSGVFIASGECSGPCVSDADCPQIALFCKPLGTAGTVCSVK